jgi:hypothetical protein
MFENVNYNFYKNTLGRSLIPDEADFNLFADDDKMVMKKLLLDGVVSEREENGVDIAVCRMIEIDYLTEQEASGASESGGVSSESINGYSYSNDRTAQQESAKLNAKSTATKKVDIIKLYNNWHAGVC